MTGTIELSEYVINAIANAVVKKMQEPCDSIINTIDFAIDATTGKDNYSVGMRNGLRYSKSLIDRKEPQFESCAEQEPKTDVIDNIRAEIIDTGAYEQEVNGKTEFLKGINYCLGVIDKYKAESENKE